MDATATVEEGVESLADPEGRKDGETKRRPMHKARRSLMIKDTEQRPGNGNASGKITFRRREGIRRRGRLEEEKGQEDKDLGENAGVVMESVDTESIETGDEDEEGREAVPYREGQMDPKFIVNVLGRVMLLHNVIDVGDGGANQEGEDEGEDVAAMTPEIDVDGIQQDEERQAPVDGINDNLFAIVEELVDNGAEEQEMNNRPDAEGPSGGGEVGFFTVAIIVRWACDAVCVAA